MATTSTAAGLCVSESLSKEGDAVALHLDDGYISLVILGPRRYVQIGKSSYSAAPLLQQAFGSRFQIQGKQLVPLANEDDEDEPLVELQDKQSQVRPDGSLVRDNRSIVDNSLANQALSTARVEEMQREGVHGAEIVVQLVENNRSWEKKTLYQQEKYLHRKTRKHVKTMVMQRVTSASLIASYRKRNPGKLCGLRVDSLAQVITLSGIQAGMRVIVHDTISGIVVGEVARRLAGTGRVINVHSSGSVSLDALQYFALPAAATGRIHNLPLWRPDVALADIEIVQPEPRDTSYDDGLSEEELARRKARHDGKVLRMRRLQLARRFLLDGCDSLVVVTRHAVGPIFRQLFEHLRGGAPFAVFSPFIEPLVPLHHRLSAAHRAVNLCISETVLREYQVLPERTHPLMNMDNGSGYILTGIKVLASAQPAQVQCACRPAKRARR